MEEAFSRIQSACLAKPGATEDYPWGETVWKVGGKMFAAWGSDSLGVKSTLEKQAVLIQHPHIKVAAYVGKHGWVSITVADEDTLELALKLIDESYDLVVAGLPKSKRPAGVVPKVEPTPLVGKKGCGL
jgi:predicted DNA-binding protein (MmcQ/YjbR family)